MASKSPLWEVPNHAWERMIPILGTLDPRKSRGRPRTNQRRIIDGIIFKIRTGCRWNLIPRVYGSDTTIHRSLKKWSRLGVWKEIWKVLVEESPELGRLEGESRILMDSEIKSPPRPAS